MQHVVLRKKFYTMVLLNLWLITQIRGHFQFAVNPT